MDGVVDCLFFFDARTGSSLSSNVEKMKKRQSNARAGSYAHHVDERGRILINGFQLRLDVMTRLKPRGGGRPASARGFMTRRVTKVLATNFAQKNKTSQKTKKRISPLQ